MSKKVLVLLANGFEEVEAVTPIDYLRRAGITVVTAALGPSKTVTGARGIPVAADVSLEEAGGTAAYDAVLIPGGMPGATNLAASAAVGALIKDFAAADKWVCAICASPAVVLAPLGLLRDRRFTCYPGAEKGLTEGKWSAEAVVVDGKIVTSRAAGTAALWALTIIRHLLGEQDAAKVAASVLLEPGKLP
ncbi:MAG: DJ-1/PfpI family protein [Spirochaetaceae bacterium]|jgi:4-methyl-5(b-hydroxyethyl)-thiazole monophosphate biosynthesis|nr:DJ-1/PfpI family protein [Spirochaetaceae bacterium]